MLQTLYEKLASELFDRPSTPELFNPYSTRHPEYDRPDAIAIRRANLEAYVTGRTQRPALLLLVEAPGPWGCRFSGVPITSESQLADPDFPITGSVSSLAEEPHKEYSAGIFWRILKPWHEHIFTWNTVPCHPHKKGDPMSIRTPRVSEIREFLPLTGAVHEILAPKAVLAVGRKAERALGELGIRTTYVRHPSQGGANDFEAGIRSQLKQHGLAE